MRRYFPLLLLKDGRIPLESLAGIKWNGWPDSRGITGRNGVEFAIYGGNRVAVVTLLLEYGADPNKQNNKGETALIHAAESDRIDLIQVLLLFGAKVEHKDNQGLTALDRARIDDRQKAIDVLLKNNGPEEGRAVQPIDEPFQLRSLSG